MHVMVIPILKEQNKFTKNYLTFVCVINGTVFDD